MTIQRCSFCGRPREEVDRLIAGTTEQGLPWENPPYICDKCARTCQALLNDATELTTPTPKAQKPEKLKPKDIALQLDEWVVGQTRAKKMLAVAVYNHMKRISTQGRNSEIELSRGNILLIGPSGCGKTQLARALAKILDVPFAIVDATPLTQAGYIGEDVESIIGRLLRAADGDAEKAAKGILYIDEIDKLAKRASAGGRERDVSGEGVQQGLLKILDGRIVPVRMGADRSGLGGTVVNVDTSQILFIGGGAFTNLAKHAETKADSGFRQGGRGLDAAAAHELCHTDLHKFGFLPEFAGRFPVLVPLEALGEQELIDILTRPRDALVRQYQRLFLMEGVRLDVTLDGLTAIARAALRRDTGARGLRAVMEELLLDVMFDLSPYAGGAYTLDERAVTSRDNGCQPIPDATEPATAVMA